MEAKSTCAHANRNVVIKQLALNGHVSFVEGIFQNIIPIKLMNITQHIRHAGSLKFCRRKYFDSWKRMIQNEEIFRYTTGNQPVAG